MKWVPLHVHSQYSILDAAAPIDEIASQAAAFGMPAVALTDHGNLFGAVEFYKACKDVKIKPIMGCEFYIAPNSRFERKKNLETDTATISLCWPKIAKAIKTSAGYPPWAIWKVFIITLGSTMNCCKNTLKD